jgi:DDE_Tnp_1-associated
MTADSATSLLDALRTLTDPRARRGIRHPFASALALTFLGLLCRRTDFAAIARWAEAHWTELREPLGFTRAYAPHATTLSRVTARYSLAEFQTALCQWLAGLLARRPPLTAAVDGKTSKQGHDAEGQPVHVLNVFVHDLRICLAQWAVGAGKATEPEVLKAHLGELFAAYPTLRLLTGDALFAQRPLARLIVEAGRDYLFAVKDNQPDLREAVATAFADATPATAAATTREKKRRPSGDAAAVAGHRDGGLRAGGAGVPGPADRPARRQRDAGRAEGAGRGDALLRDQPRPGRGDGGGAAGGGAGSLAGGEWPPFHQGSLVG